MSQFQSVEEARAFFRNDRYATENGIILESYQADGSVCSVLLTDRHRNAEGGVMGGVMLTLIDFAFATAACNVHRPTVAQQISMNFLNSSKGTKLFSEAVCRKDGKTSCVYQL
ncbi:MAG: PaaI family thioesterase, partial [Treponema sp.]|nr:PaaI family thioesterase [Treponema sp.]